MKVTAALSLLAAASTVCAAPALTKRAPGANEVIYLGTCTFSFGTANTPYSQFSWYADGRNKSQNGEEADAKATTTGVATWEGKEVTATYTTTGATISSNINADAKTTPLDGFVGTVTRHDDNSKWDCFKSDDTLLYRVPFTVCNKSYYCYPQ